MTFLKWYGLGAVGFTMVITAIGLQWAVFTESFWDQIANNAGNWHNVDLNIYNLLDALYAISAVLITFGALIGKVSPLQLIVITLFELFCHSFNYKILMSHVMHLADMGGTYIDHMFGCYFGLTIAYILGKPKSTPEGGNVPDIFSFIGTLFLWIYWPSFVAGAAVADSTQMQYAITNTILALSASTVCTFFVSVLVSEDGKFRPVDIQNATLAGGVAIGCTANLTMSGFGAIMIGIATGLVSAFGFNVIQPYLERTINLHDTCGINNLHGMPSIIGAIASILLAGYKGDQKNHHDSAIYGLSANSQWWRQWVAILLCIGFAIGAGAVVGFIVRALRPKEEVTEFQDEAWWEVAESPVDECHSEFGTEFHHLDQDQASKDSHASINQNFGMDKPPVSDNGSSV